MNIANILASKGGRVVTIRPDQTVREALELFAERNIGALIVVDDTHRAAGMITERGILRQRQNFAPVTAVNQDGMPPAHLITRNNQVAFALRIRHRDLPDNFRLDARLIAQND